MSKCPRTFGHPVVAVLLAVLVAVAARGAIQTKKGLGLSDGRSSSQAVESAKVNSVGDARRMDLSTHAMRKESEKGRSEVPLVFMVT